MYLFSLQKVNCNNAIIFCGAHLVPDCSSSQMSSCFLCRLYIFFVASIHLICSRKPSSLNLMSFFIFLKRQITCRTHVRSYENVIFDLVQTQGCFQNMCFHGLTASIIKETTETDDISVLLVPDHLLDNPAMKFRWEIHKCNKLFSRPCSQQY